MVHVHEVLLTAMAFAADFAGTALDVLTGVDALARLTAVEVELVAERALLRAVLLLALQLCDVT